MPDDKIQREIEDILSKLDDLPSERKPIPMRRRQRQAASFIDGLVAPIAAITVRQIMIVSLALIVVGFVTGRAYGSFGQWMLIAGVLLFIVGIIYSAMTRGGPAPGPKIEKRWRGQPMDLDDSRANQSLGNRFRFWFNRRR